MTVDQQFNSLNDKIQLLLWQHLRLQKENERLKQELNEAHKKESETKNRIDEFQQQISILKISSGEMNDQDKKEFEKKINQYIREVDKCIAFLSQ